MRTAKYEFLRDLRGLPFQTELDNGNLREEMKAFFGMPWEEQMKTIVAFQYFAGAAVTVEREWRSIHAAFLYISKLDNSRHSKNLIEGPWVEKKIHASKLQETLCCISLGSSLPYNLEIMFQFRHRSCHLVSEKQWNGTTLREREDGNDCILTQGGGYKWAVEPASWPSKTQKYP